MLLTILSSVKPSKTFLKVGGASGAAAAWRRPLVLELEAAGVLFSSTKMFFGSRE
jgi:hypothetical protein